MISIKSDAQIEIMRNAGAINNECHNLIKKFIAPGITTGKLNAIAEEFILSKDAFPSFKGHNGFPAAICTSINDEVVHGIPGKRVLKNGDIISIDIGVLYKGYHSDAARTYAVGKVNEKIQSLIDKTKMALYEGLKVIKEDAKIGDISSAIENYAKKNHLGVVEELVGHGIGESLHEEPDIPNFGTRNSGPILKSGMTLAIEPMLNLGSKKICILDDDWTIVTKDGRPSAHWEHTVLITKDGYEILTGE